MANKDLPNIKDVSRIPEELIPVVQWWQDKGPKTVAYTAGVLIVAGLLLLWQQRTVANRADAVAALANASLPEDYELVAKSGTPAAPVAGLAYARGLFSAGDYDKALEAYNAALNDISDAALRDIAVLGRACTLEALGNFAEAKVAVAELEKTVADSKVPHYLASEVLLVKARILCREGDKDAAKAALDPLLSLEDNAQNVVYKSQAERLVKIIDAYTEQSLFDKAAALAPASEAKPAAPAKK